MDHIDEGPEVFFVPFQRGMLGGWWEARVVCAKEYGHELDL